LLSQFLAPQRVRVSDSTTSSGCPRAICHAREIVPAGRSAASGRGIPGDERECLGPASWLSPRCRQNHFGNWLRSIGRTLGGGGGRGPGARDDARETGPARIQTLDQWGLEAV